MQKEVILTGIRSNSELTIGNYIGAIEPIINQANQEAGQYQVNLFVPDLHSFTTPIDHENLYTNSINNLKLFIAAGLPIDHPDVYVYRQSSIPAHSELAWILSCFTGFGEASRMVEFKDKSQRLGEAQVSVGLFNYPILMAADILLYDAVWIPVGEDQRQHIELTRDLAIRLNNRFGEIFKVPYEFAKQQEFVKRASAPRIRSLRNPEKKMSKSVDDPNGTILLFDSPDEAAKKVMGATTDDLGSINYDFEKQPGVSNLLQMLAYLSSRSVEDVTNEWANKSSYGELKQALADKVHGFLSDLQSKLASVDEKDVLNKLAEDEDKMRSQANAKLEQVQIAVGLRPKNG